MRTVPILAKVSFWLAVVSLLVIVSAGFGKQLGLWPMPFALLMMLPAGVLLGAVAAAVGLVWVVWSRMSDNRANGLYGWIGFIGAIAVIAAPVHAAYVGFTVPPINDITTDTEHPPQFVALLGLRKDAQTPPDYPGGKTLTWKGEKVTWAEAQKLAYPDIRTYFAFTTPDKLFDTALKVARDMGWRIVAADKKDGRIEATDTTFFFGFTDDIVIRVAQSGEGAKLDIRSKSRVGISDVGKNAARIRAYRQALEGT